MELKFKTSLIPKNEQFTIACSGGIDSIAITHHLVKNWFWVKPLVLHVNNRLFESDNIAEQNTKRLAQLLGCCTDIHQREIYDKKRDLESKCRTTRMDSYKQSGMNVIVCHHLDDAVESYLMNCFKGTPEYKPIPEKTEICSIPGYRRNILRPFLLTTNKKELEKYCMDNNLMQYVVNDPLNKDSTRGWLRREVIPIVNEKYRGLYKVVRKKYL